MSTEKAITIQAKKHLKGNWVTLIVSAIFVLTVFYTFSSIGYLVCIFSDLYDFENNQIIENAGLPSKIIFGCVALCCFSVSPIINGFFKMTYDVSKGEKTNFMNLFFYFNKTVHYFKTLLLNLIYAIVIGSAIFAFNFNWILELIISNIENSTALYIINTFVGLLFIIISIILISLVYILLVNSSMFLYSENPDVNVFKCFGTGVKISAKHFISYIKLFFRFSGWLALCFFVVPSLYVLPYITVSFATSSKWLISIEKGRNSL